MEAPLSEQRFNEDEAAAIFARAAEAEATGRHRPTPASGMTLAELQEIGREAGLQPEAVAQAAASLRRIPAARPTFLAIPIGVARKVTLERAMTDDEWGELVSQLRATFNASGRISSYGGHREWRNGNLRVTVTPVQGGTEVEMHTTKGSARSLMTTGGIMTALPAAMLGITAATGSMGPGDFSNFLPILGVGVGLFGMGVLQVPAWARRRREQFERIAQRLKAALQP